MELMRVLMVVCGLEGEEGDGVGEGFTVDADGVVAAFDLDGLAVFKFDSRSDLGAFGVQFGSFSGIVCGENAGVAVRPGEFAMLVGRLVAVLGDDALLGADADACGGVAEAFDADDLIVSEGRVHDSPTLRYQFGFVNDESKI